METITECPPEERVRAQKPERDPRRWRRARCGPYQELGNLITDLEDIERGLLDDDKQASSDGATLLNTELLVSKRRAVRLLLEVTRKNALAVLVCRETEEQDLAQEREIITLRVQTIADRGY